MDIKVHDPAGFEIVSSAQFDGLSEGCEDTVSQAKRSAEESVGRWQRIPLSVAAEVKDWHDFLQEHLLKEPADGVVVGA